MPLRAFGAVLALTVLAACRRDTPPPPASAPVSSGGAPAPSAAPTQSATPPVDAAALPTTAVPPPPGLSGDELARWRVEVARVEEARNGSGGIVIPQELRHYDDSRRFLAIQMADAGVQQLHLPSDLADLAGMLKRGEIVEIPIVGTDHVLYDLGGDAQEDPLVRYDPEQGENIRLLPSADAWQREKTSGARDLPVLQRWYDDPGRAAELFQAYADITELARRWGFDLATPDGQRGLQVRLLATARPPARDVITELARSYHAQFGRMLPVSSIIRTHAYQKRLSRVNSNATRVDAPPHTTGMAFDVSYRFMPPDEQTFVMNRIAEMEKAGRVEALRERRACFHVYALSRGLPPETRIADAMSGVDAARVARRGGARLARAGRAASRRRHTR